MCSGLVQLLLAMDIRFLDKILPLVHNIFPISCSVRQTFEALKNELDSASVGVINPTVPLLVETDASNVAIAATLNQNGRPMAFFSRTLTPTERHDFSFKKEAYTIEEAVMK